MSGEQQELPGLLDELLDAAEERALIRWLVDRHNLTEQEARAELAGMCPCEVPDHPNGGGWSGAELGGCACGGDCYGDEPQPAGRPLVTLTPKGCYL